jgi:hypothetical protein
LDAGDFDEDGRPDLAIANYSSMTVSLLLQTSHGFAPPISLQTGDFTTGVAMADVTGDGHLDILTNAPGGFRVFAGDGQGGTTSNTNYPLPNIPDWFQFADLNGDGITDIVMGGYFDFQVAVGKPGGGFDSAAYATPYTGTYVAVRDVNGDGFPDVIGASIVLTTFLNELQPPIGTGTYGTGTPGCQGILTQAAHGIPTFGNAAFAIDVHQAPPTSLGFLLIGDVADFVGTDYFGLGLLFHVSVPNSVFLAALDCTSGPGGDAHVPAPIPNNPALFGNTYYSQGVFLEAFGAKCSHSPLKLVSSNGLAITIQ